MKKVRVTLLLLCGAALLAARKKLPTCYDSLPDSWPNPVYNFKKHPLDDKKVALGRILFYDPILSRDSTISCNSCHAQYSAFTHADHAVSHGIEGRLGNRNPPVLINLAWNKRFMWDGSVTKLDEQSQKPITNPLEMDERMDHVLAKLQTSSRYRQLFYDAWGNSAINDQMLMSSLSQFMLTLVSANARYDRVMRGADTFTTKEAKGYLLFKSKCASCHTEPLFTNEGFENNGLAVDTDLKDIGYMLVTHNPADSLKFKVPTLRNIEYSAPYMHDGRFKTLNQVLNNYIGGIQRSSTLSPLLVKGLYLDANQKTEIIAFLLTLSDKAFIADQRLGYPG